MSRVREQQIIDAAYDVLLKVWADPDLVTQPTRDEFLDWIEKELRQRGVGTNPYRLFSDEFLDSPAAHRFHHGEEDAR